MPRTARIDIPGLLQHVIARGIEKRPIFIDDQDRLAFLDRFSNLLNEADTDCYAWVQMTSHFHLLLRPRKAKLEVFMRRLLTGYAVEFNLRHHRAGHLFQNRYKSIVCNETPYLLALVRYIHLNPLRAGTVGRLEDLNSYPWSGHLELAGGGGYPLIRTEEVLALFSRREKAARKKYLAFVADGLAADGEIPLSHGGKGCSLALDPSLSEGDLFDDRILGGGSFAESLLSTISREGGDEESHFAALTRRVADHFRIDPGMLTKPNRARDISRAKAVVCQVALRELGIKGIDVARRIALSPSGVTLAARRGEAILSEDLVLRKLLRSGDGAA